MRPAPPPSSSPPPPPGGHAPLPSGAAAGPIDAQAMALAELRRLAEGVTPIDLSEAPDGQDGAVAHFNGAVARFRELLVTARNQVVLGRPLPPGLEGALRAGAEALPRQRRRALGPSSGK